MFRLTAKNLWAHKLRFALTGVAVVLGVAFMAGTMVLTDTMNSTFNQLVASGNAGVDVVVQQPGSTQTEGQQVRARVPATALDSITKVDGVAAAAGTITGFGQVVPPNGQATNAEGSLGTGFGANWVDDERLNPFTISSGRSPRAPDEAVIDKGSFEKDHRQLGDRITVLSQAAPRELTVVGTASYGAIDSVPGASLVAVTEPTAMELFGHAGEYDAIAVAADDGVSPTELATRVDGALGAHRFDVATSESDTATKQAKLEQDLSFFSTFMLAFAYISLFVGMFIIYNTFGIVVAQRTKDVAMLRAIGTSRRQVLGSVVVESALVGVFASIIGLGVGVVLSFGLRALLSAVGLEIPAGDIVLSTKTIVTSLTVGVVITMVSAVAPAIRASRVKPIAALRDIAVDRSASSVARTIIGLLITAAGAAAFALGVTGGGSSALPLVGLGSVATIVGVFVLGPVLVRPAVAVLGWPIRRFTGAAGRIAGENASRSPKRTAASATALLIGVCLVAFITILAHSTKNASVAAIDRSFRADYVVDSGLPSSAGLSPAVEDRLAARPEVGAMSPVRSSPVEVDGQATSVLGVKTSVIDQLHDLGVTSGSISATTGNGVAVEKSTATAQHLAVGQLVTLRFAETGAVPMTVTAIYEQSIPGAGDAHYVLDTSTFEANVADQFDRSVYVKAAPGVSPEAGRAAVEAELHAYPTAQVGDSASLKAKAGQQIDQILNLVYGLLALAVLIALIGIANTLALSIHERTREIGLLRAVGMSRRQVRSSVRWESVLIALLGTIAGMGLAILGSWGMINALAGQGIDSMQLPVVQLAWIIGLASVAGVAAAAGPGRRAARLNVLDAIGSD